LIRPLYRRCLSLCVHHERILSPTVSVKTAIRHTVSENVHSTWCVGVNDVSAYLSILVPFIALWCFCRTLAEIEDRRALEFESRRNGDRPLTFSARRDRVSISFSLHTHHQPHSFTCYRFQVSGENLVALARPTVFQPRLKLSTIVHASNGRPVPRRSVHHHRLLAARLVVVQTYPTSTSPPPVAESMPDRRRRRFCLMPAAQAFSASAH